jgi:hypothetical protein
MKTNQYLLTILCLFSVCGVVFGDRQLERAEILEILQNLTSQPRKTWISAGTIQAIHEGYRAPKTTDSIELNSEISKAIKDYQNDPDKRELTEELQKMRLDAMPFNVRYRLSNEYTMNSSVVIKYDGERFSWEISTNSRTDSVKPGPDLEGNDMTDYFDLDWNAKRRFTWDGETYTMYSLSGNQAMIDTTDSIPHNVNGPLTAGLIPWGYGLYTYENLSASKSSAVEEYINGQTQVHLTVSNSDGTEMLFVLDAGRDYAVISYSINGPEKNYSTQYNNYRLVSGTQVPMTILIEEYDAFSNRLMATDYWNITSISGNTPSVGEFSVDYEPDALIEYRSYVTSNPVIYRQSYTVDTARLLTERLDYAASETIQAQNCATAALKYVASRLDKNLTYEQLAKLVNSHDRSTSLKTMKDFTQRCGLYCRAVLTDIQTLKALSGCQVILHFPGKNHFVVLEGIDNQYAWSVDLSKNKFYYRTDLNFLDMDWSEGTALLISDRPIRLPSNSAEISDSRLRDITGGSGYTCSRLVQEYDYILCSEEPYCSGLFEFYPERWSCEAAESGYCMSEKLLRAAFCPCALNAYFVCDVNGDWTFFYMHACK